MTKKTYIATTEIWRSLFTQPQFNNQWIIVEKVPIEKIRIDRSRFACDNPVDEREVGYIVAEFTLDGWCPIRIDTEYYLLDGQHRLAAAKQMGLKYIDVAMEMFK